MKKVSPDKEPRHPIGVVSARTGLPQDVLRAWERRYRTIVPTRTDTGRRLYSDHDVERLRLLRAVVEGGRRISDVAGLGLEELRALATEDLEARSGAVASPGAASNGYLQRCLAALGRLDRPGFESVLAEAAVDLTSPLLRQKVLVPLMETIGERWQHGTLRVVHEHLASAIVRSYLGRRNGRHRSDGAPRLVLTTPAGQRHELGALMAAAAAEEIGWDVIYLGPDLPAEEIAAALRATGAQAVALSIILRSTDVAAELRALRGYIGDVPMLIGGRAAAPVLSELGDPHTFLIEDLAHLQRELGRLAS